MKRGDLEAQLRAEKLAPITMDDGAGGLRVQPEKGSRAAQADGESFEVTGEMSAAMHEIVEHPALEPRHREILKAYLECDLNWDAVAKRCRCSMSKVKEVIERAKHLMLHPDEAPTAVDVSNEDDEVELDAPVEMALSFEDIEESLAISARTAHRIIKAVSEVRLIGNGELKANESATRTLVLLRKSELEYVNKSGKRRPAATEDLHELAGKNKVTE